MIRPGMVACALVAWVVAVPPAAAEGMAAGRNDVDDVSISGSQAELTAQLSWSQSRLRPGTRARLSGRVSVERGCARVQVEWLNAGTSELSSAGRTVCGGSDRVSLRFRHKALECARVELFVGGEQVGPTRLVCAGGS